MSVQLDLSSAFDSVDCHMVCDKLEAYSIRGNINAWISSYLQHRKLRVKVNGNLSNIYNTKMGTPQGSVLGPIIFLLFINDLPEHIQDAKIFMYADDTTVTVSGHNASEVSTKVDKVLQQFDTWCSTNGLTINYSKTVYIDIHCIYTVPSTFTFKMKNNAIPRVDKSKLLGIVIDPNLSWVDHRV